MEESFVTVFQEGHHVGTTPPAQQSPCLPTRTTPVAYVEVFVDNFVGLAQQCGNGRRVRQTLLHNIDNVLRPLDKDDIVYWRKPVFLKKLLKGDCLWDMIKNVLEWVIDTVNMTDRAPTTALLSQ